MSIWMCGRIYLRITSHDTSQFEESDNFGSLIQPFLEDVDIIRETLQSGIFPVTFLKSTHDRF